MRNRRHSLAFALPLAVLLLTGCATTPVVTEAPRIAIPATLQTCPPQPAPPADTAPDADLWDWVVDLAAAGQTCRGNLASVVRIIGQ